MSRWVDVDALINKAQIEAKGMDEPFRSNFAEYVEWLVDKAPQAEPTEPKGEDYDYQRAIEDMEYAMRYEPTYNPEDGSM